VHDELLFECPIDDAKEMAADIKDIMEKIYPMKVPLKVNVGIGPNWDDAH
jgi:DNA polymerase-1